MTTIIFLLFQLEKEKISKNLEFAAVALPLFVP